MSERKTIAKLETNPSKQAERDFLQEVAAGVPVDSYLASLFSADMIQWVEAQIRQDVSCDLWGSFDYAVKDAAVQVDQVREQVKVAEAETGDCKRRYDALEQVLEAVRGKHEMAEEKAQLLHDRWQESLAEACAAQDRFYHATTEIDRLKDEIVGLKAKLYDAMTA